MTVSDYIQMMADASKTQQHEVILECLDFWGLVGAEGMTLDQAAGFWEIWRKR